VPSHPPDGRAVTGAIRLFIHRKKEGGIMGNITRFDPFTDLEKFDPFRNMNEFFKGFTLQPMFRDLPSEPSIKLDVSEDDKAYTVKAEIPGMKKEDIEVSIDGNQVSISAEVKREKEEKEGEKVIRSERYFGRQFRSFSLGQEVSSEQATADYKDGVLTLTLPKKGNSEARKLKVS
jgi:HSP20 family protein